MRDRHAKDLQTCLYPIKPETGAGRAGHPFQPVRRKALEVEKPEYLTEEHLLYLDQLRESGVTNMFGAVPYVMLQFPDLSEQQAKQVLIYWMKTFSDRHPR